MDGLIMLTSTPGITAPVESVARTVIAPVNAVWAQLGTATVKRARMSIKRRTQLRLIQKSSSTICCFVTARGGLVRRLVMQQHPGYLNCPWIIYKCPLALHKGYLNGVYFPLKALN